MAYIKKEERSDERREIQWVCFVAPMTRVDTQSHGIPAMASGERTKLFKQAIDGLDYVVIEDPGMPGAACIPWTNVASVVWKS